MRDAKMLLLTAVGAVAGIGAAVFTTPALAQRAAAVGCSNTYCTPETSICHEYAGWNCYLDGGCVGVEKCGPE